MKKFVFTIILIGLSLVANAQYANKDGNRIGITLGVTQMSLTTNNFKTKPELGWVGGLAVRGNYYNDFSMIFGMQFTESNFTVETKPLISSKTEDVKYTLAGVQVRLLLSYNIVKDHVSLDFGPILQVNGKLRADSKYENNIISGTKDLFVNDILDVTKFNGNFYAGISAGNKRIRAIVCYQYGINNFLNNLNKKEELKIANNNSEFKGHLGIISGQLLFNL